MVPGHYVYRLHCKTSRESFPFPIPSSFTLSMLEGWFVQIQRTDLDPSLLDLACFTLHIVFCNEGKIIISSTSSPPCRNAPWKVEIIQIKEMGQYHKEGLQAVEVGLQYVGYGLLIVGIGVGFGLVSVALGLTLGLRSKNSNTKVNVYNYMCSSRLR